MTKPVIKMTKFKPCTVMYTEELTNIQIKILEMKMTISGIKNLDYMRLTADQTLHNKRKKNLKKY